MAINPVEFNGMIQRSSDISMIKHQDDTKAALNQQSIQTEMNKHENEAANRVNEAENADYFEFKYDAKDEGRNKYFKQNSKKIKEKKDNNEDGRVVKKNSSRGFDILV